MFDIKKIPKHTARAACHKFGKKAFPNNPLPFIYRGDYLLRVSPKQGPRVGTCAVQLKHGCRAHTRSDDLHITFIAENKSSAIVDKLLKLLFFLIFR
jgi:hypothetical protein